MKRHWQSFAPSCLTGSAFALLMAASAGACGGTSAGTNTASGSDAAGAGSPGPSSGGGSSGAVTVSGSGAPASGSTAGGGASSSGRAGGGATAPGDADASTASSGPSSTGAPPDTGLGGGDATASGDTDSSVSGSGATGPAPDSGGGGPVVTKPGADVDLWYEAEATENVIDNGANAQRGMKSCGGPAGVVEGASCASGGGEVKNLLGRGGTNDAGGGVTFTGVTVPSAGSYDVTWWYHCGADDNWNDHNCGGNNPPWMTYYNPAANPQPGCRPHLIAVNGVQVDGSDHSTPFWQFPCFGGSWDIIHAATTTLDLAAGANKIRLGAPHIADLDGVDIDAIHVVAAGKGNMPKVVAPVPIAGDNGRK